MTVIKQRLDRLGARPKLEGFSKSYVHSTITDF